MGAWPITIDDVRAARERLRPTCRRRRCAPTRRSTRPSATASACGQAREPPADRRVQGPQRRRGALRAARRDRFAAASSPRRAATTGSASLGRRAARRAGHGLRASRQQPGEERGDRGFGARLVEEGRDYDESVATAERLVRDEGLHLVHSTNDASIVAGAATLTLEMLEEAPEIDALVFSIGGGSQAVGALTVARALRSGLRGLWRPGGARLGDPRRVARRPARLEADGRHLRRRPSDAQHLPVHLRGRSARVSRDS